MRTVYIGIDPGAKGFAVFFYPESNSYDAVPLEDTNTLREYMQRAKDSGNPFATIEDVHAMPKQGVATTFKFGYNVGMVTGMVIAMGIPYTRVAPGKWQRTMWAPGDAVRRDGKTDTKRTSFNAARRLHPDMTFMRTKRCKTYDDNLVDATLICDFAIRNNL